MENLTKKEIAESINVIRRSGFGNGFDYSAQVRGFYFNADIQSQGLYEIDETGYHTRIGAGRNKKEIVNDIYDWFKKYAAQHFDY